MRKVRIEKRTKTSGKGFFYLVVWTIINQDLTGKARYKEASKSCQTMTEARLFQHKKYQELNSDVYYEAVSLTFDQAQKDFIMSKEASGIAAGSITQLKLALKHFPKKVYLPAVDKIRIEHIEEYIRGRQADSPKPSAWTISSELSALRTFFNWCKDKRYNPGMKIKRLKCPRIAFRIPSNESIAKLFSACPCPAWRVRLLISLCTGLRAGDVDRLLVSDINLARKSVTTHSKKTGKVFVDRPLPDAAIPEIESYLKGLPDNQTKLFVDINRRKEFEKIRLLSGLPDFTRQKLRKTASTLMQMVGSLSSAQQLMEHSDSRMTQDFYSDQEIILHWKVNQLPVKLWIEQEKEK